MTRSRTLAEVDAEIVREVRAGAQGAVSWTYRDDGGRQPSLQERLVRLCAEPTASDVGPEPAAPEDSMDVSVARERLTAEMERLLDRHSEFRTVALFFSYRDPDGGTHVVHGSGMKVIDPSHAVDFSKLVAALRQVSDELQALIAGKGLAAGSRIEPIYWKDDGSP